MVAALFSGGAEIVLEGVAPFGFCVVVIDLEGKPRAAL
jgi:hypothetical protein